jgi:hypothetical protein
VASADGTVEKTKTALVDIAAGTAGAAVMAVADTDTGGAQDVWTHLQSCQPPICLAGSGSIWALMGVLDRLNCKKCPA